MGNLIGICNTGAFMTKRYIDRYGITTKWARQFHKATNLIVSTNGGMWREGAQGYTSDPKQAGKFDLETAWACIKDLGPEKYAKIILPGPVNVKKKKRVYIVEIEATIEITASDPEEAASIADSLAAPLDVFPGVSFRGRPVPEEEYDK